MRNSGLLRALALLPFFLVLGSQCLQGRLNLAEILLILSSCLLAFKGSKPSHEGGSFGVFTLTLAFGSISQNFLLTLAAYGLGQISQGLLRVAFWIGFLAEALSLVLALALAQPWLKCLVGSILYVLLHTKMPKTQLPLLYRLIPLIVSPILLGLAQIGPYHLFWGVPILGLLQRAAELEPVWGTIRQQALLEQENKILALRQANLASENERQQAWLSLFQRRQHFFDDLTRALWACDSLTEVAQVLLQTLQQHLPGLVASVNEPDTGYPITWVGSLEALSMLGLGAGQFCRGLGQEAILTVELGPHLAQELDLIEEAAALATTALQSVKHLLDSKRQTLQFHQLSRLAAQGQLAAGLAHEVNTPLCTIAIQLGLAKLSSPMYRDQIEPLLATVQTMQRTIQTILSYSRSPAFEKAKVDLNSLVAETVTMLEGLLSSRSLKLRLALWPLPLELHLSGSALQQIVLQLLLHIICSSSQSGCHILVETREGGSQAYFCVYDQGEILGERRGRQLFSLESSAPEMSLVRLLLEKQGGSVAWTRPGPPWSNGYEVLLPFESRPI